MKPETKSPLGRRHTWILATCAVASTMAVAGAAGPTPGPRPPHKHEPTPAMIEAVREIVPPLATQSDEAIAGMLRMMPPNYEWYLSDADLRGPAGVLIVTHGFGETGDGIFARGLSPVARKYPTAVAFGMAMMTSMHIQEAVDDLVAAGASTVVMVPATQSEFDTGIRQYAYIVGHREEPAYMAVPRVSTPARVIVTAPLADHPIATDILLDQAREISTDEPNEVVIIVGHGPVAEADNLRELATVRRHADRIRSASRFADVRVINLQDDAAPEVRAANVADLRKMVTDATQADRRVLIIGFLLGTAGIQPKIEADLEGLSYRFNPRGMSENPRFADWVATMVREATARSPAG